MTGDQMDLFDALGFEAGADWRLVRRPYSGKVSVAVSHSAARKLLWFIDDHPEVRDAIMSAAGIQAAA